MPLRRVAFVVRPAEGGIRRHVSQLLNRLDQTVFDSTVFAPPDFLANSDSPTVRHIPARIGAVTSPIQDMREIVRLGRIMRGDFDLVHAHGLRGALIGVPAARIAKLPALMTVHNLVPRCGPIQLAALRYLGRTSRIVAVSRAIAGSLSALKIGSDPAIVIPNGVDIPGEPNPIVDNRERRAALASIVSRAVFNSSPDLLDWLHSAPIDRVSLFVVGAVGRLSPEKGFDTLIEGFCEWMDNHPATSSRSRRMLVIAGSGGEVHTLKSAAEQVPNVVLAGAIADVTPLWNAVDVAVAPSREEGQGIAPLEAMAAGRPVIASRVGGLPESIAHNETGLLISPNSPQAIAEALNTLEESPELRRNMGEAGFARVRNHFSIEQMINSISELYLSTTI